MEVLLLLLLILLNGAFAMSEIALVTARRSRLQVLADEGDGSAALAIRLGEKPTHFLSTVQIGITSIGLLNGIVGQAVLAAPVAEWLHAQGFGPRAAQNSATAIVVLSITFLSIVLGELVPKRLGQLHPEPLARLAARPLSLLSWLTRPFVYLLAFFTNAVLALLGQRNQDRAQVTEAEIQAVLLEGSEAGVIEPEEHAMVRRLFGLDERPLRSFMVPRNEIVWIDVNQPPEQQLSRLIHSHHSRFPVCDGDLGQMLGVVHTKRLMGALFENGNEHGAIDFRALVEPASYVLENNTGLELLELFRERNQQMAFIVDEYGSIVGMVTLQDLLEAVTGHFGLASAADSRAHQREDGSWLLDGALPLPELAECLGVSRFPEQDSAYYHTLSGLILLLLDRLPATGDKLDWNGWRFEVIDMDGRRIDKVLASRQPPGIMDELGLSG
ncbi:MAG: hemolysin family protein [Pseudomonadales bacterium]|jgi:putative hemolysin|nr:hemolysin family protein [Pseudomonadales bacterium]